MFGFTDDLLYGGGGEEGVLMEDRWTKELYVPLLFVESYCPEHFLVKGPGNSVWFIEEEIENGS